jgi:hypothetical protein
MFEPLNALERALVAAATDPSARRAFTDHLLESELYISPAGDSMANDGRGQVIVSHRPEGDRPCVFTARERVTEVVGPAAAIRGVPGRELLEVFRGQGAHINPNLAYGVVYSPADVAEILDGVRHEVVAKDEPILLAHPAQRPEALIAALGAALGARREVKGAWLMLSHRASEPAQSWMVGVDHDGAWAPISQVIGEVVSRTDLQGRALNATPLQDNDFSRSMRGGIPLIAALKKRGLFDFLKG